MGKSPTIASTVLLGPSFGFKNSEDSVKVDFRMALYGSENTCDSKIVRAFRTIGDTVSSIIRSTFTGSKIVKVVLNNAELIPNKKTRISVVEA